MMGLHENDAKSRLVRFLNRKAMPRRLEDKPVAMDDEIGALLAAMLRHAPRGADALAEWWPAFEATLGEMCGAMWPTEKEVSDAGRKHRRRDVSAVSSIDMSDAAIAARQMDRGEGVSVSYLYGIAACEMIARRLVSEDLMTRYRSAWFFGLVDAYGEERACEIEADAKARHEEAKIVWSRRNDEKAAHPVRIPDKSAPIPADFAA